MASFDKIVIPNYTPPASSTPGIGVVAGQSAASQLPGYGTSVANIGGNIQSETAGQVPDDVKYQLAQAAAERGVATGSPGGANANADYLRSLGLTSLNLTNLGESNLNSMLPNLPGYNLSQNPAYYQNVQQTIDQQLQQRLFDLQQQQAQNAQAQQQAALKAAQAGLSAGMGSYAGQRGGGISSTPASTSPWVDRGAFGGYTNPAPVGAIGGGTVIGGQTYYGADVPGGDLGESSTLPMLNNIIQNYDPTQPSPANDFLFGTGQTEGVPDLSVEQSQYYESPDYSAYFGA